MNGGPRTQTSAMRGSGHSGEPVQRSPGAAGRIPPERRPERLRTRVIGVLWLAVWELARRLPEAVAFGVADLLGRAAHRAAPRAREQVRATLGRVVPEALLDRAVAGAFRSYARYWVEAFRAADLDPVALDARTTARGVANMDAALDRGRGIVVLLAHHGSWDVAARWAETHGYHMAAVAEVVRPRRLFARFVALREAVGIDVVPLGRGARLVPALGAVLADNHLVGLLADRDLSRGAPPVTFFGEPARIPRGPAVLAARTGAAVVPVTMLQRPGRRWHLEVLPALALDGLDIDAATGRIALALEELIRLDPQQWHCFSPVFAADTGARAAPA